MPKLYEVKEVQEWLDGHIEYAEMIKRIKEKTNDDV